MKIKLEFAELHTPLFLGGRNFGLKLDGLKFSGIDLVYVQEEKELWVTFNKKTAIIPTSNVVSMTPHQGPPAKLVEPPNQVQTGKTGKFQTKINAQVSTPQSHVFDDGPGAA